MITRKGDSGSNGSARKQYGRLLIRCNEICNQAKASQLAAHIQQQAVALRLQAGSQEAGFLAAFCPVSSTPALVVI